MTNLESDIIPDGLLGKLWKLHPDCRECEECSRDCHTSVVICKLIEERAKRYRLADRYRKASLTPYIKVACRTFHIRLKDYYRFIDAPKKKGTATPVLEGTDK